MALIKCKECGHEVSDKASTCPNCGCPIEKGLVCSECGNNLNPNEEICPNCGNPVKSKNGFNWKIPILSFIVLLFLVGGAYGVWHLIEGNGEQGRDVEITAELSEAVHRYDVVSNFHEGLSAVCKNQKWSYINSKGDEVIPCKYGTADYFSEGLARVRNEDDKFGFIDKKGELVIPCKYDFADCFSEGLARVGNEDNKYGFIDKKGELVIPCKYDFEAESFSEGLARVRNEDNKYGFIDKKGELVIPCKYDYAESFSEGLSAVCKNDKRSYINSKGDEVIPCKYDYADCFSEGLARVRNEDDKFGFIDKKGELVIPCKYDYAESFSEGLALVRNEDNKYGFIDKKGELVIPCKYDYAENFSEGLAVAFLNCGDDEIFGFVDKKGNDTFTESDFAQLSEYEKQRQEEAKRAEEERLRQEEEIRRQGVEKVVSITIERNNRSIVNYSGNYGATKYSGMWEYFDYAITNFIRIPNGKVWIFKRTKVSESGLWSLRLFYYPKERGNSGVNSFDDAYKLPGNPPVLRAGDGFRIAAESLNEGVATVEVYFSEKDEEYYY